MTRNMNAMCFCGHKLAQHSAEGKCQLCLGTGSFTCNQFTEKLTHRCEVCDEPLPIVEAPNEEIVRLRFKDDGKNYAHKKCLVNRRDAGILKKGIKPVGEEKGRKTKAKQEKWPSKEESVATLSKTEVGTLLGILSRFDVIEQDGEVNFDTLVRYPDEDIRCVSRESALMEKLSNLLLEGDGEDEAPYKCSSCGAPRWEDTGHPCSYPCW